MYQVRYPLQAAEAHAQSLWGGKVWNLAPAQTIQQAVLADIQARLQAQQPVEGTTSLSALGVLTSCQAPVPPDLFQGADAFRLGCVLSQKTRSCSPASCWRLVHHIVHQLQGAQGFEPDVITMYLHQHPDEALIVKALKNNNFYQALSLVRSGLSRPLSDEQKSFYLAVLYPMVPHAALYISPSAQTQAPVFYRWLLAQPLPCPVLVNNRRCAWLWEDGNATQKVIEKEVLSFPSVLNKIQGRTVQHIIYKKGKVVHVVV